jgi:hypothetical protein
LGGEDNCCAVNTLNAAIPTVTNAASTPTTAFIAFSNRGAIPHFTPETSK